VIREAIIAIVDEGRDLTEDEAHEGMNEIMRAGLGEEEGVATPAQLGAFLTAIRMKGESVDEIVGMAKAMREHVLPVEIDARPLLDTCGTGGSSKKIFNASTAAAFVAAAAGAKVAKHGNRAMTSKSGSADFLEALGAQVSLTPKQVATCVELTGIGFMFAQSFHPAMKFAGPIRHQIGIRNVFNILGPLTNPAGANCHVMGVANQAIGEKLANAINRLGIRHALVVNGADGLDDLTVTGESHIFEVMGGKVTERTVTPFDLGVSHHHESEISGGTPEENAQVFREVLAGDGSLAVRDLILANAGASLYVTGLATSIKHGAELAAKAIDSGDAAARVGAFVEATQRAR
jgi:anthranilate phosphoribosyltransferase